MKYNTEVLQLKKLRAMGINGLSIGTESGDEMKKYRDSLKSLSQDNF